MQTAEERYEYAWQDYQASRERGLYKTLKSYCQAHLVNYEGMRYWKRRNVSRITVGQTEPISSPKGDGGFITIKQGPQTTSAIPLITDVEITCPSGISVHIGSLPTEVLLSILLPQKGDGSCSL